MRRAHAPALERVQQRSFSTQRAHTHSGSAARMPALDAYPMKMRPLTACRRVWFLLAATQQQHTASDAGQETLRIVPGQARQRSALLLARCSKCETWRGLRDARRATCACSPARERQRASRSQSRMR